MSSPYTSIAGSMLPKGLPDDAVPFAAVNATDITTTTAQEIKAAVASKRHFITEATAYNMTTAEDQILMIRHGTTDIAMLFPLDVADNVGGDRSVKFDPPLVIPTGVAISGIGVIAAVGDCVIAVNGYVGT